MTYAVEYHRPNSTRKRRTRFLSLKMAKIKKEIHEQLGFMTHLIPRSELHEVNKVSRDFKHNSHMKGTSNLWQFFFPEDKHGDLLDVYCIKNGKTISLRNLP